MEPEKNTIKGGAKNGKNRFRIRCVGLDHSFLGKTIMIFLALNMAFALPVDRT